MTLLLVQHDIQRQALLVFGRVCGLGSLRAAAAVLHHAIGFRRRLNVE
ncbi:hypothetical protein WQQ_27790 [Hydrocarboniphaga effusa AP103]|uniref:Uncharacterized protein n=1 Tax=Hydrocarboniphaga effusa AP103 TaxID=1172194 RepID=I7ZC05_9GAMM|nr:hypothetical protein WQQ_27790 [Hydrocarboniphaga effusa AP103]